MVRTVISELKITLFSKKFVFGVLSCFIVLLVAEANDFYTLFQTTDVIPFGHHADLVNSAITSDTMILALPVLCTIPYATRYVDDIKSHFVIQYLPRSGVNAYIFSKLITAIISGGLLLVLGILGFYGFSAMVVIPMEAKLVYGQVAEHYFIKLLGTLILYFASGAFWSVVGFVIGSISLNKYMSYASPFIVYYILIIFTERYFKKLHILYPKEWIAPSDYFMGGNLGVILVITELTVLLMVIFWIYAKRRLIVE